MFQKLKFCKIHTVHTVLPNELRVNWLSTLEMEMEQIIQPFLPKLNNKLTQPHHICLSIALIVLLPFWNPAPFCVAFLQSIWSLCLFLHLLSTVHKHLTAWESPSTAPFDLDPLNNSGEARFRWNARNKCLDIVADKIVSNICWHNMTTNTYL